jgi:6-pyruvoyltetrahydropterin/6-carboxytetrahydropterin synthase
MRYEITVTSGFSASHQLRLYNGSLETMHGHNWTVILTVAADKLDAIGVVMDFHVLERKLWKVIGPFHNHNLNEVDAFCKRNPSAENVANHIAESLSLPGKVRLVSVEVWETPENRAKLVV